MTGVNVADGIVPPFSFVVPEGLRALPIAPTSEERTSRSEEFVREFYSRGDEELWDKAAPYYSALGEAFCQQGLAFSALGFFATEEGGVARCTLNVAIIESGHPAPDVAADGALAALVQNPSNDARRIDLPCGPATACTTVRKISVDAQITSTGEPETLDSAQTQIYVPFPTGPYMAVFTLESVSMDYWDNFCNMMAAILQTVSFEEEE